MIDRNYRRTRSAYRNAHAFFVNLIDCYRHARISPSDCPLEKQLAEDYDLEVPESPPKTRSVEVERRLGRRDMVIQTQVLW